MTQLQRPLHFKEASLDDLALIMEMEVSGFALGNRERQEVYAQRIACFPQGSLLAYVGSACVGCFFSEIWQFTPNPGAECFTLGHDIEERHDPLGGTELYISSMTLAPTFRGQGLGPSLFAGGIGQVAACYPQLTSALLLVNESWHSARKIYAAAGFEEIAQLKHFFLPGQGLREDGIVMRRDIAPVPSPRRPTLVG